MYLCTVWWNEEKKYYHLCDMNHKEIEKLTSIFDELLDSKVVKHYFFDTSTGMPYRLSSRILKEEWKNGNLLEDIARGYFDLDIHYQYSEDYFNEKNKRFVTIYSIGSKNTGSQTNEITGLDIVISHDLTNEDNEEDEYTNTEDNTSDEEGDNDDNDDNDDDKSEDSNNTDNDDEYTGDDYHNGIETDSIDSDDEGDPMGKPIRSTESKGN